MTRQLFTLGADSVLRAILGGMVLAFCLFWPIRHLYVHSSYATNVGIDIPQPILFSHEHHVGRLELHCLYCHSGVEKSSFAGMPATSTCMHCHQEIWSDSPLLAEVRASYLTDTPIHWNKVTALPDFVYFDHSIHVAKGIGCETCHGRVDRMPLTQKAVAFQMEDCVACHRAPAQHLRPQHAIYTMGHEPAENRSTADDLLRFYGIETEGLTDCTICHR